MRMINNEIKTLISGGAETLDQAKAIYNEILKLISPGKFEIINMEDSKPTYFMDGKIMNSYYIKSKHGNLSISITDLYEDSLSVILSISNRDGSVTRIAESRGDADKVKWSSNEK